MSKRCVFDSLDIRKEMFDVICFADFRKESGDRGVLHDRFAVVDSYQDHHKRIDVTQRNEHPDPEETSSRHRE